MNIDNTVASLADSLTIKQALIFISNDLHDALVDHSWALGAIMLLGTLLQVFILIVVSWFRGKQLKSIDNKVNALVTHFALGGHKGNEQGGPRV